METLILTYEYSRNEFVKAMRQYLIANGTIRKYDPAIVAVILLFSILLRFVFALDTLGAILLVLALIFSALTIFLYFHLPVLVFKQNSKYHEEYTLTFSKEKIVFKTSSIDSVLQWSVYSELWESDDFYFLIQSLRLYSIIPKRAFLNPADKGAFEEIALSNIKKTKRKI